MLRVFLQYLQAKHHHVIAEIHCPTSFVVKGHYDWQWAIWVHSVPLPSLFFLSLFINCCAALTAATAPKPKE